MENTLDIRDFLIFKKVEVSIRKFTVFIGPQASGKSIVAKLLYLFYHLPEEAFQVVRFGKGLSSIKAQMEGNFSRIFPREIWKNQVFEIRFQTEFGKLSFVASGDGVCEFSMSGYYEKLIQECITGRRRILQEEKKISEVEEVEGASLFVKEYFHDANWGFVNNGGSSFFVPAGRSFFAAIEDNIFSFILGSFNSEDFTFDFLLVKFAQRYTRFKKLFGGNLRQVSSSPASRLLGGIFIRKEGKDFIRTNRDGVLVDIPLLHASSGQQELLPILTVLDCYKSGFLMIEEPEAHIFPAAQDEISRLIVAAQKPEDQEKAFLITTHSPYVLNALNNMAYAGFLAEKFKGNKVALSRLKSIYREEEHISPKDLSAYFFEDGRVASIVDSETHLIDSEKLDAISYSTSDQFSELLKLEQEVGEYGAQK